MQDHPSNPLMPEESPSATGSWRPGPAEPGSGAEPSLDDPPTVRRGPGGSASGSGSMRGVGSGSGVGVGRGPMEVGLPSSGDRLDSFEIQEPIGVGGMGAVFRALDVRLDRFVALKVLPPGQSHEAENVRRFYQEGRAAARLDHENIARVYTIGQDKSLHYIAFEYIDGTTIRQRVEQRGPLPVDEAINFTLQIAGALVHASERGVVHRDIKPSNIIVTPQGRAKLVDMGLARRFEREGADDGLTQSNMTLGTFDYISPEQARDPRSVDVRSDLYSLGCTMYHMLTGQPPFPGGTVLQKLLSHREEPAPDVRGLNPAVPSDLATIILKLMAKDPDRRYQTPEQLVRDLLTLAGALGLRSISPEGLVWINAAPRAPGWERHLFWGLPAAVLLLVVAGLVWMGREQGGEGNLALAPDDLIGPVPPAARAADPAAGARAGAGGNLRGAAPEATGPLLPGAEADLASAATRKAGDAASAALPPRERRVRSDEDLRAVLRSEPPGSTVVLADDGPYRLAASPEGEPPIRADLTIRAADGARPVVEPAGADGFSPAGRPLLHFAGGRVTIEGVTFLLGSGSGPAIRAEGTALTLGRCVVRGAGQPASLELVGPAPGGSTGEPEPGPMPAVLESCAFGGGSAGIVAKGLVTLGLRDCAIAARGPAISFANASGGPSVPSFDFGAEAEPSPPPGPPMPARLMLDHVSIVAGEDPMLRFAGTAARVEVSDSLFAPPQRPDRFGTSPPTLVAIDDPDRLSWMGFGNVYARIGTFLLPTADPKRRPRTFEFDAWAGGPSTAEARSRATTQHVWAEPDPGASLARGEPVARAFRPSLPGDLVGDRNRPGPGSTTVGARRGPSGPIEPVVQAQAAASPTPADPARLTGFDTDPMTPGPMVLVPEDRDESPRIGRADALAPRPTEPVEGEAPPVGLAQAAPAASPAPGEDRARGTPRPATSADDPRASSPPPDDPDRPLRTASQFLDRLAGLGPKGGVIRLAADARLDLPASVVSGTGIVEIQAEPGPTRPLLRFRPELRDQAAAGGWSFLMRVDRQGELQLRGIDLVVDADSMPGGSPRAAFGLSPDATLELADCTVTIDGAEGWAVVRLLADEAVTVPLGGLGRVPTPFLPAGPSAPAHARFVDSLIRSSGNVVDVPAGAQLDELKLTNVVASCAGSLVLGQAGAAPLADDASAGPRLALALRRATVIAHGGIVRLTSTPDRPSLPLAEVSARESVLATGPGGGALFRVEGQGELDGLGDRIRVVESRDVAYHRIDEYRRDQTAQLGALPVVLDREEWALSVGRNEGEARHGDIGFLARTGPERDPRTMRPEDLRLDPEGPARDLGPDLDRIPEPPLTSSSGAAGPSRTPTAEVLERLRRAFPGLP